MYYEEKMINGILMCRSSPDGSWRQCSIEKMSAKIIELKIIVNEMRYAVSDKFSASPEGREYLAKIDGALDL